MVDYYREKEATICESRISRTPLAGGDGGAGAANQRSPIRRGDRTETKQVLVDAVVTDKKGNYVPDLSQKDFKCWRRQGTVIRSFAYERGVFPNSTSRIPGVILRQTRP